MPGKMAGMKTPNEMLWTTLRKGRGELAAKEAAAKLEAEKSNARMAGQARAEAAAEHSAASPVKISAYDLQELMGQVIKAALASC